MSVYSRDNINYAGMLQNAITNRVAKAQREAQYIKDKGELWGNTVKDVTKTLGRGAMASADMYGGDSATTTVDEILKNVPAQIKLEV